VEDLCSSGGKVVYGDSVDTMACDVLDFPALLSIHITDRRVFPLDEHSLLLTRWALRRCTVPPWLLSSKPGANSTMNAAYGKCHNVLSILQQPRAFSH
jgi:hypothetical protein